MSTTKPSPATRSALLQKLKRLHETGQISDNMDRALTEALAHEAAETEAAIKRIAPDLQAYETQYGMSSDDFYRQFQAGDLGDRMDFIEWNTLVMMKNDLQQRLDLLK